MNFDAGNSIDMNDAIHISKLLVQAITQFQQINFFGCTQAIVIISLWISNSPVQKRKKGKEEREKKSSP